MRKKEFWIIFGIFLFALVIRLLLLRFNTVIETDTADLATIGKNLLNGRGYMNIEGDQDLIFPPLYPILIGIGSFVSKNLGLISKMISLIFGALLILPVYLISKKFYNKEVAILSAIIISLYPALTYISTVGQANSLYLFLAFFGIYFGYMAFSKRNTLIYLITGILFGLAYLARIEAVVLVAVLILLTLIVGISKSEIKKSIINCLVLIVIFSITISPYLFYLYKQTGEFSLSQSTGVNLLVREKGDYYTEEYEKANFELVDENTKIRWGTYQNVGVSSYILRDPKGFFKRYLSNFNDYMAELSILFPFILMILIGVSLFNRLSLKELYLGLILLYPLFSFSIFYVEAKYLLPMLPIFIIWMSKGILDLQNLNKKVWKVTLVLVLLICVTGNYFVIANSNEEIELKEAGLWLKNRENVILMDRKPFSAFYADAKYVYLPYDNFSDVLEYANYKKATHVLIAERYINLRPQLKFLLKETPDKLNLIYDKMGVRIFEIKR